MSERIRIAPPQVEDCDPFLAAVARSKVLHADWVHPPASREDFEDYLRASRDPEQAYFLIRDAPTGELAGVINVSHIIRGCLCSAFVGFYALNPYDGRGYMKAGLLAVLEHAFTELRLHRVEANVQPGNEPSRALVRACGFRHEGFSPKYLKIAGVWRDHERWAILQDDFETPDR